MRGRLAHSRATWGSAFAVVDVSMVGTGLAGEDVLRWGVMSISARMAFGWAVIVFSGGCSEDARRVPVDVGSAFPTQWERIRQSDRRPVEVSAGLSLSPRSSGRSGGALEVVIPDVSSASLAFSVDGAFSFFVHEIDRVGAARVDGDVVRYGRVDGSAYWTGVPSGVEEWLVLDDGVEDALLPAASWVVSGAQITQQGEVAYISELDTGRARVRVSAHRAFGPDGAPLDVRLHVTGDRLEVFVAASPGPVLVDPLWQDLSQLGEARYCHASALLSDERVLTTGGIDSGGATLATAEVYKPNGPIWETAPSMGGTRHGHTLTVMADGRVVAHGGDDGSRNAIACPEVFTPGPDVWLRPSVACAFCTTVGGHTATAVAGGFVFYAGGLVATPPPFAPPAGESGSACTEMFELSTNEYRQTPDMTAKRYAHAAALLDDGSVLISGGENSGVALKASELFFPSAQNFKVTGSMGDGRSLLTLTKLCDGMVLAVGGKDAGGTALSTTEFYDPNDESWSPGPSLAEGRYGHTATLLPSCGVLVVGGWDAMGAALESAEIYDPKAGDWVKTEEFAKPHAYGTATLLADGGVLVAGGTDTVAPSAASMVYRLGKDGDTCAEGRECESGFCTDGRCCASECSGPCEACASAISGGSDGACVPIAAGADPDGDCADQGVASCGRDGTCDGARSCALYDNTAICAPAGCQGHDALVQDQCDGAGTCVDAGVTDCGLYTCVAATCLTTCASHGDCDTTEAYCDGNACQPHKALGATANEPEECASGLLADGVCCDGACTGTCSSCLAAFKSSGPNGECGPVAAGLDPDAECADQGAASCGTNGGCDGASACALYAAGTSCAAATCQGHDLDQEDTCDGAGTCSDSGVVDCQLFSCAADACLTTCAAHGDCDTALAYCEAPTCANKKPPGAAATAPEECISGFVSDGVCCDSDCTGACRACTAALKGSGADGTCGDVTAGTDPDGDCADTGPSNCGTTGACDSAGGCAVYDSATVCTPAVCNGHDVDAASTCDGVATCQDHGTISCGLFSCDEGVCLTSCAAHSDCDTSEAFCGAGGICEAKKALGQPAATPAECTSGFVADDVCCDSVCDLGVCDACAAASGATADGTCTDVVGDCEDGNACTADRCEPATGCVSTSRLDGASCDGGICVAGNCVADPEPTDGISEGGSSSEQASGSGGGDASTSSSGGNQSTSRGARLTGGGFCQFAIEPRAKPSLWWLAVGAALMRPRRRRAVS